MDPVRFERPGEGRRKGCFVYLLMAPVVTLLLGVPLVAVLGWLLPKFGASDATAAGISAGYLVLLFVGVSWMMGKEYRSHGAAVTVSDDRIELELPRDRATVLIDSVESLQLRSWRSGLQVILGLPEGQERALPPDIASYRAVREAFEARVVPRLLGRLEERLRSGGEIPVQESSFRALAGILGALLRIPVSVLGIASLVMLGPAVATLLGVPGRIRRGFRGLGGGGVLLRKDGVVRTSGAVRQVIAWNDLSVADCDEDGLVLRSRRDGMLRVSVHAEHYWPASRWMIARLSRGPGSAKPAP